MLGLDEEKCDGRANEMIEVKAFKTPSVKTFPACRYAPRLPSCCGLADVRAGM
jgi:hypothetical protein